MSTISRVKQEAIQAQSLLDNEMLIGIFLDLEENCIKKWSSTTDAQSTERETYYHKHRAIQEVKRELRKRLDALKIQERK